MLGKANFLEAEIQGGNEIRFAQGNVDFDDEAVEAARGFLFCSLKEQEEEEEEIWIWIELLLQSFDLIRLMPIQIFHVKKVFNWFCQNR